MSLVVDSHAHVMSADRARYPTRPLEPEVEARCFADPMTAERLLADMDEAGVGAALLVQRGQIYGFDNDYVCDAARVAPKRLRPVVAIDARAEDCVEQARAWIARGAVGLRLMGPMQGGALDWLAGDRAAALWRFAADEAVPVCVHFFPDKRAEGLVRLGRMLDHCGPAPVVIDHLSNAPIASAEDGIDTLLASFADRGHVALKFSTIPLARLRDEGIDAGALLGRFVAAFGADRLMWGSDIAQSPGSYAELAAIGREATAGLDAETRGWLRGGTAARVYRLP